MKRRTSQADADKIRAEYEQWDKFGADSETSDELARRLNISKATLYRLRDRHWRVDGATRNVNDVPVADHVGVPAALKPGPVRDEVVQWLTAELLTARAKIAELEQRLKRRK